MRNKSGISVFNLVKTWFPSGNTKQNQAKSTFTKSITKSTLAKATLTEAFKKEYPELFNQLRIAINTSNIDAINKIKASLSDAQFLKLLEGTNKGYSEAALIHYAINKPAPQTIKALVQHLSYSERLKVFLVPFEDTGCKALHWATSIILANTLQYKYQNAIVIKALLFRPANPDFWIKLLSSQTNELETPVHYAARLNTPQFLQLFSDELLPYQWEQILSIKNDRGLTAVDTYLISNKNSFGGPFIYAIRGPLNDEAWVHFLIKNKIVYELYNAEDQGIEEFKVYFRELTIGLSATLINQLVTDLEAKKSEAPVDSTIGDGNFHPAKSNVLEDLRVSEAPTLI
jgi:hypothetical protein